MNDDDFEKEITIRDILEAFGYMIFIGIPISIAKGFRAIWTRCTDGYWTYADGSTSLHKAARKGDLKAIEFFLKKKRMDINKTDEDGDTALIEAIRWGHVEIVNALVAAGANVSTVNKYGTTPLYSALGLRTEDGRVVTPSGCYIGINREPIRVLISTLINALAKGKVNVNETHYGKTPLYKMAQDGYTEIVKALIAAGADVNKVSKDEVDYCSRTELTPLYVAVEKGHVELVKVLIAARADVNKAAKVSIFNEDSPLLVAVSRGHIEIIKELIAHGANIRDNHRGNILDFAKRNSDCSAREPFSRGRLESIKLLIVPALLEDPDKKIDPILNKVEILVTTWNSVLQEITRMQNEKIPGEGYSLYNFLKTNLDELANNISLRNFNLIDKSSLVKRYPQFSDLLQNRLQKLEPLIQKRAELLDFADRLFLSSNDSGSEVTIVSLATRKILEFLPNKDIKSVMAASFFQPKLAPEITSDVNPAIGQMKFIQ